MKIRVLLRLLDVLSRLIYTFIIMSSRGTMICVSCVFSLIQERSDYGQPSCSEARTVNNNNKSSITRRFCYFLHQKSSNFGSVLFTSYNEELQLLHETKVILVSVRMAGWHLEVFRMAVYISFPVGLFYFFNQPSFFESWMMEKRANIFPTTDPKALKMLEEYKEKLDLKKEQEWLAVQETKKL